MKAKRQSDVKHTATNAVFEILWKIILVILFPIIFVVSVFMIPKGLPEPPDSDWIKNIKRKDIDDNIEK